LTKQIDQFLASLAYGDAQAIHAMHIRDVLRTRGASDLYFGSADPRMENEGHYYWEQRELAKSSDGSIYHLGIGSAVAEYLLTRDEPLYIDYHDITPPEYFTAFDPISAELLEQGHWQLESLAERATFAWAHSEFAKRDLEKAGCRNVAVLPILMDFEKFDRAPDQRTLKFLRETKGSGPDVLFVGIVKPNKAHQDLIKLARVYAELFERPMRVFCVGSIAHRQDRYASALKDLARELGVEDRVFFTDSVSLSQLRAYYSGCDAFVSMSEHEGFNLPIVEAMHIGTPVIAYAGGAVPETIGGGGLVLENKDLVQFAAAVDRVFRDNDVRESLVRAGRTRVQAFRRERVTPMYEQLLLPQL
jgi:glycosyltransferase involved in cell wall biosynthesis